MKLRVSWAVLALVFFISAWAQAATAPGRDCRLPGPAQMAQASCELLTRH